MKSRPRGGGTLRASLRRLQRSARASAIARSAFQRNAARHSRRTGAFKTGSNFIIVNNEICLRFDPRATLNNNSPPQQYDEPQAFDPQENGLFIAADGFSSSVPWKVQRYGVDGPLADAQISSVAAEFFFEFDDLRKLSGYLGIALHPSQNLISVSRSIAVARAAKEIQRARNEIETAIRVVSSAILRLERVQSVSGGPDEAQRLQQAMVLPLQASLSQLSVARSEMEKGSKRPEEVLLIAPDDKRRLHDRRREHILRALFHFWADSGRNLTFTTDPLTSERRGPLIAFVNAVVACVTEPPNTLKAETIVAELRKFRGKSWTSCEN